MCAYISWLQTPYRVKCAVKEQAEQNDALAAEFCGEIEQWQGSTRTNKLDKN